MMLADAFIAEITAWVASRHDIRALALVGSYARAQATDQSDIDVVLVCSEPTRYLGETSWMSDFGKVARFVREDWGKVQSLRAFYASGVEVEFGIASAEWTILPPDPDTMLVLKAGARALVDRDGNLSALMRLASESA